MAKVTQKHPLIDAQWSHSELARAMKSAARYGYGFGLISRAPPIHGPAKEPVMVRCTSAEA